VAKLILILLLIVLVGVVVFLVRKRDQSLLTKIGIVGVGAAIGIPLLVALYYHSTYATLSGFISNVAEAFGWPSEIVAAISVLMIVPSTIAFGMVFSLDQVRRRTGVFLLTLGISAYWVLVWAGTNDHMVTAEGGELKCYTISIDGVRYFDQQQVDPRTGEMCQWVNQENLRYVLAIDEKIRSGEPMRRIPEAEFAGINLFATGTNGAIPLVWYYRTDDNAIELFDVPGIHPIFGEALTAITPEIAREWLSANESIIDASVPLERAGTSALSQEAEDTAVSADVPEAQVPEQNEALSYSELQSTFRTNLTSYANTTFRVTIRSIEQQTGEAASVRLRFSLCNVGTEPTYYEVAAYFTDSSDRTIYWPRRVRVDFPVGYCKEYVMDAELPPQIAEIDFMNGKFFIDAQPWWTEQIPVNSQHVSLN
jgi:hypothetical protein